jgi:hypothetical protein
MRCNEVQWSETVVGYNNWNWNKGLQYNLQQQHKKWIEQLALEAETEISKLNILEQDHYRHLVANNIKNLIIREQRLNTLYKEEWNIIKNIKDKIKEHNLIIMKADKGKSIIIMEQHEYTQYIEEFIKENNYTLLQHNPTKQYQQIIMNTINKSNIHVNKSNKHKFYNPNTEAPTIRATIKIHKNPIKIRPIVNWKNAPAYQLATQTSKILTQDIQLPHTFNITNTTQLMEELKTTPINTNTRICSFDITNMYTNIPTTQRHHNNMSE